MTIQEIRALTGLNKAEFAKKYNIPYRSIQNWELGERECPEYVRELLEFKVKYDINREIELRVERDLYLKSEGYIK